MSEKINPEVDHTVDQTVEDDPLAELARIVAGEPEPILETREPEPEVFVEPQVEQSAISELDMEAALADALGDEVAYETPEAPIDNVYQEQELNVREEITRAVDQVVNEEVQQPFTEEPTDYIDAAYEAPISPEAPRGYAETSEPEGSFEDGLISALENELSPDPAENAYAPEAVPPVYDAPAEPADFDEVANSPEFNSLEDALSAELDGELADSPIAMTETFEEPVYEAPQSLEAIEPQDFEAVEEVVSPQPVDEDLGAAFANEFEQMLAQDNAPATEFSVPPAATEQVFEPAAETEIAFDSQPVEASASPRSLDDLDFGSAFAEELGVESVEEVSGWENGSTEAAQAEFSDALQTEEVALEFEDPGHSGQIPGVPNEAMFQEAQPEEKSGSSLKYAMAALIIALFAGSIFAGYGFLGGGEGAGEDGEPPVIKAETDAIKEKPEDPGGRIIANQDKASYEKVEGSDGDSVEQENLISNTEEPAEIISTGVNDGTVVESNLAEKTVDRLSGGGEEEAATAGLNANGEVTPRVVQTVTVKPDGTIVPAAPSVPKIAETVSDAATELASNALSSVGEATTSLTETIRIEPKPVATELIKRPEPIDGAKSTGATAVPEASPLPKPVVKQAPKPVETAAVKPEQPAAPAAVRRSEWVVQVSSQRTPEAAQSSFTNLRNRFGVLQGRPMSVQRANVNGSTFYRVRVQTTSRDDANQLCTRLKSAGGSCFVTR